MPARCASRVASRIRVSSRRFDYEVAVPYLPAPMALHWPTERIVVTGGAGFLGSFVLEELRRRGAKDIFVPRSKDYDLVQMEAVKRLYADAKPTLVIHMAAQVGGIGANRDNP